MKPIDSVALKYIEAQAKLNDMIRVNKDLLHQNETLIEMLRTMHDRLSLKK